MTNQRRPGPTTRVRVEEWRGGAHERHEDRLTTEEPLEIRIAAPAASPRRFGVTMRTPGNDFELAAGLLLSEGIVAGADDIDSIAYCTDEQLTDEQEFNVVTVRLSTRPRTEWNDRQMAATSACGVCGTDSLDAVDALASGRDRPPGPGSYAGDVLQSLPDRLRSRQRVFERTGGLHAAGLYHADGTEIVCREDVGRHNAVDKAVGHCLLYRVDLTGAVLCTSGRLGFEIVQKAVMSGIGAVVAVGAPTSLAVSLAQRAQVTAAGFVRDGRMILYAGRLTEERTNPSPDPRRRTSVTAGQESVHE